MGSFTVEITLREGDITPSVITAVEQMGGVLDGVNDAIPGCFEAVFIFHNQDDDKLTGVVDCLGEKTPFYIRYYGSEGCNGGFLSRHYDDAKGENVIAEGCGLRSCYDESSYRRIQDVIAMDLSDSDKVTLIVDALKQLPACSGCPIPD